MKRSNLLHEQSGNSVQFVALNATPTQPLPPKKNVFKCLFDFFCIPYNGGGLSQARVVYFVADFPQVAVQDDHGFHDPHCPSTK
jgi:hypothetical protein